MPGTGPAVVVDGVSKTFSLPKERVHTLKERALHPLRRSEHDDFRALNDVSFRVEPGEFFGIVGRNGSGKSTLLKCMAGIYKTDSGQVWVAGRVSTFIELGVGFNPDLAARDNAILNAIMLGLTPAQARERYERIIDFAELREFEDLKLKNYSSGMLVRLAFSVMIQVDADVLLIDEVLAVGDAAFQQKCYDEFNRLRDEGRTILLVTHDMAAVSRFCDRAMLIERGRRRRDRRARGVGAEYLELELRPRRRRRATRPSRRRRPPRRRHASRSPTPGSRTTTASRVEHRCPGQERRVRRRSCASSRRIEDPVFGVRRSSNDEDDIVFATSTTVGGGAHRRLRGRRPRRLPRRVRQPLRARALPRDRRRSRATAPATTCTCRATDMRSLVVTGARRRRRHGRPAARGPHRARRGAGDVSAGRAPTRAVRAAGGHPRARPRWAATRAASGS